MKLSILVAALLAWASSTAFADTPPELQLEVKNMTCAACPITVRKALERVPGVKSIKVDFASRTATVGYDPARATPEAIMKATADAGFPSVVKKGG